LSPQLGAERGEKGRAKPTSSLRLSISEVVASPRMSSAPSCGRFHHPPGCKCHLKRKPEGNDPAGEKTSYARSPSVGQPRAAPLRQYETCPGPMSELQLEGHEGLDDQGVLTTSPQDVDRMFEENGSSVKALNSRPSLNLIDADTQQSQDGQTWTLEGSQPEAHMKTDSLAEDNRGSSYPATKAELAESEMGAQTQYARGEQEMLPTYKRENGTSELAHTKCIEKADSEPEMPPKEHTAIQPSVKAEAIEGSDENKEVQVAEDPPQTEVGDAMSSLHTNSDVAMTDMGSTMIVQALDSPIETSNETENSVIQNSGQGRLPHESGMGLTAGTGDNGMDSLLEPPAKRFRVDKCLLE